MNLKNYYKPTPKKWRRIGDAILATSVFITGGGLMAFDTIKEIYTPKQIRIALTIIIALGAISKFITNLYKQEEVN